MTQEPGYVPASTEILRTPSKPDLVFDMRHDDWDTVRDWVKEMAAAPGTLYNYISLLIGSALTLAVGWITWNPPPSQLTDRKLMGLFALLFLLLAVGLWLLQRRQAAHETRSAKLLDKHLDRIAERNPREAGYERRA